MNQGKYYYYPRLTLRGRRWFWRFVGRNGEIVGSGEGYRRKGGAMHAIDLLRGSAGAPAIELSSSKEEMP